jgi:exopolysaccharide biosynthesis protein
MINEDQLKYWTTGPIMAFDLANNFYYFKDSRDFGSVSDFESKYGVKLQAAIGNKPRLIENGLNVLIDWEVDAKQRDGKYLRNAIAYRSGTGKGEIILVILRNANLNDLASFLKSLKVDYALNLDGGASAALIYNGEYMVGPGRNIPNAIVFAKQAD